MTDTAERVQVVTSFVCSGDRIALVKRSDKVKTYQGLWAAFSGYIEGLPIEQAYTELAEEARLTDDKVRLRGIGIPLPVDDDETGRRWLVFPFIFQLRNGVEMQTDWEAQEFGWFSRDEVRSLPTVPGLNSALSRVWPPFGSAKFWEELSAVATDTEHGATFLARRGLTALGEFVQAHWETLTHAEIVRAIRAFAASRPVMGIFPDLAARLLLAMQREPGQFDLDALISELLGAVDDATALSSDVAAEALADVNSLFTLSYGQAVKDTIVKWHKGDNEVVIAESEPGKEGLRLAQELADEGVTVRTVPDSEIVEAVKQVDAVLVGSDAITETDELQNKIGTRTAVMAANGSGIPAYAVTQTVKVTPPGWPVFAELHRTADGKAVPVFDRTPLKSFEAVFTENGALTPDELVRIHAELSSVELLPPE